MITPEVTHSIERSVLCWLATADQDGHPNVSPKEVFTAFDDRRLLIANIASPGSVKNIKQNPNVCVSFVDVFVQKGFKLRGTASLLTKEHPLYAVYFAPLEAITKGEYPIASIIEVLISGVEPIVAPSYRLYPNVSDDERIRKTMERYGVR